MSEQTMEEREESQRRWALSRLATLVRRMAEERHEEKKHEGDFRKCDDPICAEAQEVDKLL